MRTSETVTVLRAAFVLVFATLTAWAQSTAADIVGTVTDPSGAVVSNVLVKVTQEETNFSRETHSNSEGIYEFRILQPGTYTVTAEATGFKKYVNGHIPLAPRQVLRIDIPIAIGNLADTINVVAEAPVTNTEMGTVAESRNSMLLSRGPQGTLVMGTFGYNTSKYSLLLRDGGWTEASFKADGSHARQWQASIDGNAAETAYPGLGIPYQAVSDENVTVVNASAEFRTPVTIDAVTKGGTNQLHGSYTWGLGHQALNALAASASTSRRGPQGTVVMGTFGYNTSKYLLLLRDGGWTEASFKADGSHARQWQASIDGNAAETAYPGLRIPVMFQPALIGEFGASITRKVILATPRRRRI